MGKPHQLSTAGGRGAGRGGGPSGKQRVKSASRSSRGSTAGVKGRSSHRLDGQGTQDRRVSAGDGAMAENRTETGGRRRMGRSKKPQRNGQDSSKHKTVLKKKQQKLSGVRKAGKITKSGTGQGKELPLVVRAKGLWERLRRHDLKKEKRVKVRNQLLELLISHIHVLALKHDGACVVQCLLKYGTEQIRGMVYEELKDHIPELCILKYAKFTVKAMLKYCPSSQRDGVISGMYCHVTKLVCHREAVDVVEAAYNDHANAVQHSMLTQEFYGPQYALFKNKSGGDMAAILSAHPDKKRVISTMKQALLPLLDK